MPEVPPDVLAVRSRSGADRWDEMWNGVLHMPPMPNREHQDLALTLAVWLREHWGALQGNTVWPAVNVALPGAWPHDYRIPDLVLVTADRLQFDRNEYFEGPPLVVVEVRSPGDETLEKLPFYARLGVPEVWVIGRDDRTPEVLVLSAEEYRPQAPDSQGWIESPATGVRLRSERTRRLAVQLLGDAGTRQLMPRE